MLKAIVVCLTIAVGSLIGVLSTGQTTPEDVEQWMTVSTERINTYLIHEFGMWVTQHAAPLVSAALTLCGCVVYTLLFRKVDNGKNREGVYTEKGFLTCEEYKASRPTVGPQGGTGVPPSLYSLPDRLVESEAVKKAKARQLKNQLVTDKLALQAKQKHTENSLSEAQETEEKSKRRLELAKRHYEEMQYEYKRASNELENLKTEHKKNDRELQSINEEIQKLDGQV